MDKIGNRSVPSVEELQRVPGLTPYAYTLNALWKDSARMLDSEGTDDITPASMIIGTTAKPEVLTSTSDRALSIQTTYALSSGWCKPVFVEGKITTEGASLGVAQFEAYVVDVIGGNATALYGKMKMGDSGHVTGLACGVFAYLKLFDSASQSKGTYVPLNVSLEAGSSFSGSTTMALTRYEFGGTKTYLNDTVDFFLLMGCESGSNHMFYNNTLRCKILTTNWYMPLSSAQGSYTTAYPIVCTGAERAITIGTKATAASSLPITATSFEAEPGSNYLFGLFCAVADASAATSKDELRSTWIRTRVNEGRHVGSTAGWGFGVCGAEIQLKIYADGAATEMHAWQNSAVWAQLETQGAGGVEFKTGSYSQCVLANVGLTNAATTIDAGAVVAGITINSNTGATVTDTGGFYGLFITDKNGSSLDFQSAIYIADSVATTGISIGTCATGISMTGTYSTGCMKVDATDDTANVTLMTIDSEYTKATDWHRNAEFKLRYKPTGNAGDSNLVSLSGICFLGISGTTVTGDGKAVGVTGLIHFYNAYVMDTGASDNITAALNGVVASESAPVMTSGHITTLHLQNNMEGASPNDTSGIATFIYVDNDHAESNSGGCFDSVMHIRTSTTPYLFDFPAGSYSSGIADDGSTAGASCIGHLKLNYRGQTGYINVYSDNS